MRAEGKAPRVCAVIAGVGFIFSFLPFGVFSSHELLPCLSGREGCFKLWQFCREESAQKAKASPAAWI